MKEQLAKIRSEALAAFGQAQSAAELDSLRVQYLGKKGELTAVLKMMGKLPAEERPAMGQLANEVRSALEAAIAAIEKKLADEGYKNVTISKAGSTYTFSGQDKLGYDSKFTWDVDTDLVEVITYTLNGKETTAPAGETITYTSNWIVVNGKGVQTDVIPEAGDVIDTDMLAITVDGGKPEYIKNGSTYTVEAKDGSTTAKIGADYVAYGDASAALNADTVVTTGFVKYTIMNADDTESSSDYVVAGEAPAAVTGANGTGFIYTVGDVDKGYLAYSSAIPAADMTGDVVVYRGYVTVTYVDTNDIGITGEEVVKYNETSLEVTYGVGFRDGCDCWY